MRLYRREDMTVNPRQRSAIGEVMLHRPQARMAAGDSWMQAARGGQTPRNQNKTLAKWRLTGKGLRGGRGVAANLVRYPPALLRRTRRTWGLSTARRTAIPGRRSYDKRTKVAKFNCYLPGSRSERRRRTVECTSYQDALQNSCFLAAFDDHDAFVKQYTPTHSRPARSRSHARHGRRLPCPLRACRSTGGRPHGHSVAEI